MSDIVIGRNVSLEANIDGSYIGIGCAATTTFRYVNEIIGKTDVNAGLFRKKRVRISDFSASVSGLVTLYNTTAKVSAFYYLQEAIRRSENDLRFTYTDEGGVSRVISGLFLVETHEMTHDYEGFAEFDIEFQGTGDLTISDLPSPADPDCFEAFSDWWTGNEGASTIAGTGDAGKSFAGHEILEVVREMGPPLSYTAGTPGDREYAFDGTTITTWSGNPYSAGERIFVIWQVIV